VRQHPARAQVLALVRSRVNLRFSLTAEALADRVLTAATPTSSRQESIEPAALTHAAVAPHDGGDEGLALARFVRKAVDGLDAESKLRHYRH